MRQQNGSSNQEFFFCITGKLAQKINMTLEFLLGGKLKI